MKNVISGIIAFILILCTMFCLTSCDLEIDTTPEIEGLTIESFEDEEFYTGKTYTGFKLEVDTTVGFETDDINLVISDDSIIDITYEKKKVLLSEYISFDIDCKNTGTATFYFETTDRLVKSEQIELTVCSNITSIKFTDNSDLTIYSFENEKNRYYNVKTHEYVSDVENALEFVSENPSVAIIKYNEDSWLSDGCIIEKVGAGETYVYIRTKDKTVQSEKIKVTVEEEQEVQSEEESETGGQTYYEDETPVDNSRRVYVTPYGEKYHYRKSCAGKNARATTENEAKDIYDPCKKCAR